MQAKERRGTQFKRTFTHDLCDFVRTISKWPEWAYGGLWSALSINVCCQNSLARIWNLFVTWRCSCFYLYLALAFCRISWIYFLRWWIFSNKIDTIYTSTWACDNCTSEDEMGRATSMGGNGWNPKDTLKGLWLTKL